MQERYFLCFLAAVSFIYEIVQDTAADDNEQCDCYDSFGCFLRHLAFGADGVGVEGQCIVDFVGSTHCGCVSDDGHCFIHSQNRDFKFGVSAFFIDREIFFPSTIM